jgi:hypothetical protein
MEISENIYVGDLDEPVEPSTYRWTWWSLMEVCDYVHGCCTGSGEDYNAFRFRAHVEWLRWRRDNWAPITDRWGRYERAVLEVLDATLEEASKYIASIPQWYARGEGGRRRYVLQLPNGTYYPGGVTIDKATRFATESQAQMRGATAKLADLSQTFTVEETYWPKGYTGA